MEQIQQETGLDWRSLVSHDDWAAESVVPTLWRLIHEVSPEPAVALTFARHAPPTFFGPLGQVLRYAPSLRSMLQLLVRYRRTLSDSLQIELIEAGARATIRFRHPNDQKEFGATAEAGLALGARLLRDMFGAEGAIVSVGFTHVPVGPLAPYEAYFGTPVVVEAEWNYMELKASVLDCAPPDADELLEAYASRHLALEAKRLGARHDPTPLAKLKDAVAAEARRGVFDSAAVARRLHASIRTVQRIAVEHGESLGALIDRARCDEALRLVGDETRTIDEVADRLGYSSRRAFERSFKRWTGTTPAQYRERASSH